MHDLVDFMIWREVLLSNLLYCRTPFSVPPVQCSIRREWYREEPLSESVRQWHALFPPVLSRLWSDGSGGTEKGVLQYKRLDRRTSLQIIKSTKSCIYNGIFIQIISPVKKLCFNLWLEYYNLLKYTHMKGLLKNLGLILILVGVVILLACSFTGNVNNNAILGTSVVLVVLGLISYIVINKKIAD